MGQKHNATNVVAYIKQESIEERLYARQSAAAQTVVIFILTVRTLNVSEY
jgi:hypothetical protein